LVGVFPYHSGLGDGVSICITEGNSLISVVFIFISFNYTNRCHLFGELCATRAHELGWIIRFILLDIPEKLDDLLVVQ
jgi:hypothetical protein